MNSISGTIRSSIYINHSFSNTNMLKSVNPQFLSVVIGIGSYNDLGLIRSCGEIGIKSIYLVHSTDLIVPINRSKYVSEFKFIDLSELRKELETLLYAYPGTRFILFGASDEAILKIEEISGYLSRSFCFSRATGGIKRHMRKDIMAQTATDIGLKIPITLNLDLTLEDSQQILSNINIPLPLILKPTNSVEGAKVDMAICSTRQDLSKSINRLRNKGYKEILAQEYLNDDKSIEIGITGVSHINGEVEINGLIYKIRNRANINNYGKYDPFQNPSIMETLKNYIRRTGYIGIFDTDFIFYKGQFYFIECNFRNGAYGYAVTKGGFNMCASWASDFEFHYDNKKIKRLKSTTFMEERTDVLNVLDKSMSLRLWLKDFIKADTLLWWNWRDPMPMIRIPEFIKNFSRRLFFIIK